MTVTMLVLSDKGSCVMRSACLRRIVTLMSLVSNLAVFVSSYLMIILFSLYFFSWICNGVLGVLWRGLLHVFVNIHG